MGQKKRVSVLAKAAAWLLVVSASLAACTLGFQQIDPEDLAYEPFIPPTLVPTSLPTFTPQPELQSGQPDPDAAQENSGTETGLSGEADCADNLTFISDVTIADGTVVAAGSTLDKQWEVENSGTCNWGDDYTLQLVTGEALGDATEVGLVPARAGSRVTVRIVFTAPDEPGSYHSAWQAHNPEGTAFGDPIYMTIEVE